MTEQVLDDLQSRSEEIRAWLKDFLRIPSVSADPAYRDGMEQARNLCLRRLTEIGLCNVQLLDGGGEPAIYGEWLGAPGKPTLMVYGHYDVQPPDPIELWRTPPFEPTEIDGRLYARGASDVKGSTTIALEVIASYLRQHQACPVNIKVFLEGEEEKGSPTLRTIIERYRDLLCTDGVLSADGGRASALVPTINTGARGNGRLEVALSTASKDLHSGRYGGAVRNALHEMAQLVACLHTPDGAVAVPGFYDGAITLSDEQRADTAAFPFDESSFLGDVGGAGHGEPDYTMRERITLRPCLDVNGMWGGYTGAGGKTVIPHQAFLKISVRVVQGQNAMDMLHAVLKHMRAQCPEGVSLELVSMQQGSSASTLPAAHPLVRAAETVLLRQSGRRAIHVRLGATVPITSIFKESLGVDTLMFGYNLPDEDVHAPNEFFRLQSIDEGLRGWTALLEELGKYSQSSFSTS